MLVLTAFNLQMPRAGGGRFELRIWKVDFENRLAQTFTTAK